MLNSEISKIFREIARILEIKGENVFRIRAYERAAQNIEALSEDIEHLVRESRLLEIPGVGKDLSQRITEYVTTGRVKYFEDLKKTIPHGVLELLNVPSVGPKTARLLYEKLKIKDIGGLESAIAKGKLKGIFGIKEKTIANILKGIDLLKRKKEKMALAQAMRVASEFEQALKRLPEVKDIVCAGSLRRRKEIVRDIDILVASDKPQKIMEHFVRIPGVAQVQAKGETKSSVRTKEDVQVDCRVVGHKSFGAALVYFTGSKNFNIKLRQIAIKKGLKINEYGVFKNGKFICGKSEKEIFEYLGMEYIPPELREDTGEIELALESRLPELVELKDIRGDFHAHSTWSDGENSIEQMAHAAKQIGHSYIAITDHSQSLKVANGLSLLDLKKKKLQIEGLNKRLGDFVILYGTEVDIDSEGKIDYNNEALKEFDIVVAAVHSGFKQPKDKITRRLIRACQNKYVHIIAHPTGRLWGVREPYEIDFEEFLKAARDTNTHLEINAFPDRLDLNDLHCRKAKEAGVKLAIGTDAHTMGQLAGMELGVAVARRGWLAKKDVINTLEGKELFKEIKK